MSASAAIVASIAAVHYSCAEDVLNQAGWSVRVHAEHSVFPKGCPVPLVFDYCNDGPGGAVASMDHLGVPRGLSISLISPAGEVTELHDSTHLFQPLGGRDPPRPMHRSQVLQIPERMCVRLAYDLNRMFLLDRTGRYTVRVRHGDAEPARNEFTIVDLEVVQDIVVDSEVEHQLTPAPVVVEVSPLQCRIRNGTAISGGVEHQFVVVQDKHVGLQQESGPQFYIRVPRDTTVVSSRVDVRWRLWVLLRTRGTSGANNAMVIGNLYDGTARTAISWTGDTINFGATWAQNPFKGWVVFAGTANEPVLSTHSEAATHHGRSIDLSRLPE